MDLINIISPWMKQVPDTVWSAIIASILTFIGVLWTNKGNEKRQIKLLEHEKEKHQAELRNTLKKDVFLEVASSFAAVLHIIPKLADLNLAESEINKELNHHSSIVAKTYLSANENTVVEILKFDKEIAKSYLELLKTRVILLDNKRAVEIYQETINNANEEKNRILSIIKELNLQYPKEIIDDSTFSYINKNYQIQEKILTDTISLRDQQQQILDDTLALFWKECISVYCKLNLLLPPMCIALRRELNNNVDSQIFTDAVKNSVKEMKEIFDQYLSDIS